MKLHQTDPSTVGTSPTSWQPPRWRRLVQYRLRTLLIVTTVIALLCALYAYGARWLELRRQEEHQGMMLLCNLGATLWLDDGCGFDNPALLKAHLRANPSAKCVMLKLDNLQQPESDLFAGLQYLHHLRVLMAYNTSLDDHTLECLTSKRDLFRLLLSKTRVTDRSVPLLKQMTWLETLTINDTEITDRGLPNSDRNCPIQLRLRDSASATALWHNITMPQTESSSPVANPRRFQFTIRGLVWSTFWAALSFAAWSLFSHGPRPGSADPLTIYWFMLSFMAFPISVSCAFAAIGALLNRTSQALLLGFMVGIVCPIFLFLAARFL